MRTTLCTLALTALLLTGCGAGRFVQKGMTHYEHGNYVGAMDQWSDLANGDKELNDKGQVRYLVYRGLTHYHLGQRPQALAYLSRGKAAYTHAPSSWLKPTIAHEMDQALADLSSNAPPPQNGGAAPPPPPVSGGVEVIVIPAQVLPAQPQ